MKIIRLFLLTATGVLILAACDGATERTTDTNRSAPAATPVASVDEFAAAKSQYARLCADCHGDNGDGGTVQIDDKPLNVPSLKEGHALEHSDQELVKQILDGGEGMPAFKDKVSTAEAAELVRFIRRTFQD